MNGPDDLERDETTSDATPSTHEGTADVPVDARMELPDDRPLLDDDELVLEVVDLVDSAADDEARARVEGDSVLRAQVDAQRLARDAVAAEVDVPDFARERAMRAARRVQDEVLAESREAARFVGSRRRRTVMSSLVGVAAACAVLLGTLVVIRSTAVNTDSSTAASGQMAAPTSGSAAPRSLDEASSALDAGAEAHEQGSAGAKAAERTATSLGVNLPDLGELDSLNEAILSNAFTTAARDQAAGTTVPPTTAGPQYASGPAPMPCEINVRANDPLLLPAPLVLAATARYQGQPVIVLAFTVPATPAGPTTRIVAADASTCAMVASYPA